MSRDVAQEEQKLDEVLYKALKSGDLQQLEELLIKITNPEKYQEVLKEADKLTKKQESEKLSGKNLIAIRNSVTKRAVELIAILEKESETKEQSNEALNALEDLKTSVATFKENTVLIKTKLERQDTTKALAQSNQKQQKQENPKKGPSLDEQLIESVKNGDKGKITELLQSGANINARDKDGKSGLAIAINNGNADMVNFLMDNNAQINIMGASASAFSNVQGAIKPGYAEKIGSEVGFHDRITSYNTAQGRGAMVARSEKPQEKEVGSATKRQEYLEAQQEEINRQANENRDRQEIMERLEYDYQIARSALSHFRNLDGNENGNFFGSYANDGDEIDNQDSIKDHQQPFDEQELVQDIKEIDNIIAENGPIDPGILTDGLAEAIRRGNNALALALIAKGADLNSSANGEIPLQVAHDQGNSFIMSLLIAGGANPNISDRSGQSIGAIMLGEVQGSDTLENAISEAIENHKDNYIEINSELGNFGEKLPSTEQEIVDKDIDKGLQEVPNKTCSNASSKQFIAQIKQSHAITVGGRS